METVNLTINGQEIRAKVGQTILEVALANGIYIPHLCYDPRLKPFGACRLCLVQVKGSNKFVTACSTLATEGMVVNTDTVTLHEIRRTIVELLLSDHAVECITCEKSGACRLQDLAYQLGVEEIRFSGEKHEYHVDDHNPLIERDYSKCILCGRCVRICDEVQGVCAIGFANRGFDTVVSTPYDRSLLDTPCEFCGQCVSTCPVGALIERTRKQKGRVWETKKTLTVCPYCGCGCQIELVTRDNEVIAVTAPLGEGINEGNLCSKGRFGFTFINHSDRLQRPLIRKRGKFVKTSWDEALSLVAEKLSLIKQEYGADAIVGLSSAKCTNEENYLFQKFMRAVIGTNNIDHCARL
jgi:predicted molibdopterin-dependent oxidoreductase YjgC